MDSYEVCLHNVRLADIIIVLVKKEYGSTYNGENCSITQKEGEEGKKHDKIIIPIINKKTWDEYEKIQSEIKEERNKECYNNKSKDEIDTLINKYKKKNISYINDYRVIDFIRELASLNKSKKDNFISTYKKHSDITNIIESRLKAISYTLITKICNEQYEAINNRRAALFMSPQ